MSKLITVCIAVSSVIASVSIATCADIVGSVSDAKGYPIANVQITARTPADHITGQSVTDANGKYWIAGLNPDTYHYVLDPLRSGYKGGNAVSYLDSKGLILNWKISRTGQAIALASPGSSDLAFVGDPFGLTGGEFAGVVLAGASVLSGVVVGGVSAAGGFGSSSSSPSGPPASPSH